MKFAAVFAFALFAFVAQAYANPMGGIEVGIDIVKKEVAVKKEHLQTLVSKETVVVLSQISNSVSKVRNQAIVATQKVVDNIANIAARLDALKREAAETNKKLQDMITVEHGIVDVLIKKVSANVNNQIGEAAKIVLDKVCKAEDRLMGIFMIKPIHSKKEW